MRNKIVHLYLLVALAVLSCPPAHAGILKKLYTFGKVTVLAPVVAVKAVGKCTINYVSDVFVETGVGMVELVYFNLKK